MQLVQPLKGAEEESHQFTVCGVNGDDATSCLTPQQLGAAVEQLMPLTTVVEVNFLHGDLKTRSSAALVDSTISAVHAVVARSTQTFVACLTGARAPIAKPQESSWECAVTILTANTDAAERREMQAAVIVLLVTSSPGILSGLLLTFFLVLTVGLYFCILGDIRPQTEFVASYPYKGKQYD
jgi:hypothetical protein